jgi:ribosomal protein L40E
LKSIEKKSEKPSKQVVQKICSECGDFMEEGNLIGPGGIYWSKEVHPSMLYGSRPPFYRPSLGSEPLTFSGRRFSGRVPNLRAYRCRKCGTIFVDSKSQNFGLA